MRKYCIILFTILLNSCVSYQSPDRINESMVVQQRATSFALQLYSSLHPEINGDPQPEFIFKYQGTFMNAFYNSEHMYMDFDKARNYTDTLFTEIHNSNSKLWRIDEIRNYSWRICCYGMAIKYFDE
jgi:hypothetical protein